MKTSSENKILKMLAKPFGALLLVLTLTLNANAQLKTFVPVSGNWSVAGNWAPGGVPTNADYVVIPDGSTCTVNITNAVCKSLAVGQGGGSAFLIGTTTNRLSVTEVDDLSGSNISVLVNVGSNISMANDFVLTAALGPLFFDNTLCMTAAVGSKLVLGAGVFVGNGNIEIQFGTPGILNLYDLEINLGDRAFTYAGAANAAGLNIAGDLRLISGEIGASFDAGAAVAVGAPDLAIVGDLIVPFVAAYPLASGPRITKTIKNGEPLFSKTSCEFNSVNLPPAAVNVNEGATFSVRDVKIATGATLYLPDPNTYIRVRRDWGFVGSTGAISTNGQTPTIEFSGATNGVIQGTNGGNHVNFSSAFVLINKAAANIVTTPNGIISTGNFAVKNGIFDVNGGSTPTFQNICISGGNFQNSVSTVNVSGNWTIAQRGLFWNGLPATGAGTTINFIGNTPSIITVVPDGFATPNLAQNQPFRNLLISKTGTAIVENAVGLNLATIIRVKQTLTVNSGTLFINDVINKGGAGVAPLFLSTGNVPLHNQTSGYFIAHADASRTDVPPADLDVREDIIINAGGGLNFAGAKTAGLPTTTNNANTNLTLWVGGAFSDLNTAEPTPTAGFYIGNPSINGKFSDRPLMVFDGNNPLGISVSGAYTLRNSSDATLGTKGIILPNVILSRLGVTNADAVSTVFIGAAAIGSVGLRVLGDMVIGVGYRFSTNGKDFYFGDQADASLANTDVLDVFGRFLVDAGSTFFMSTGGNAEGTMMRVRQGGHMTFGGTPNSPVLVSRDINAGTYYRICAYSGSNINAAYADFLFQGSSNNGFFTTLPVAQTAYQFNYGTGAAQNVLNNGTPGVNRDFFNDLIDLGGSTTLASNRAGYQSKGGLKILKGASIGTANTVAPVPNPTNLDADAPATNGFISTLRNFSSCSFQVGASNYTALTINTGQALDITEASFTGSSPGGIPGTGDYNIVNFFDDYQDASFNTDGVNNANIIFCYGCLGARAGELGEIFDGGYIGSAPAGPTPTTTGRGDARVQRLIFLSKQLVWWTGEGPALDNNWSNRSNWTLDRTNIANLENRPNVAPGIDGAIKREVSGNAAYITNINNKIIAQVADPNPANTTVFTAAGAEYTATYAGSVGGVGGSPRISPFLKTKIITVSGLPVTIYEIAYKELGETNRDYEVLVARGGNKTIILVDANNPTVNYPDIWITGGLFINGANSSTERTGLLAGRAGAGADTDKTVNIDNKILRIENDVFPLAAAANYDAITHIASAAAGKGNCGVLEVGGALVGYISGRYRFTNLNSVLRLISNGPRQQVRLDLGARDMAHLEINKVLFDPVTNAVIPGSGGGSVLFQGNAQAMVVRGDCIIKTGDLFMSSETPFIVERDFEMLSGGSIQFEQAYGVFGGNFKNNGVISNARRFFFTPINTTLFGAPRSISTGGAVLPPVTFVSGAINWSAATLPQIFNITGNNTYATGAGVQNSFTGTLVAPVVYNLLDNFRTSGTGGFLPVTTRGTIIQQFRRVNTTQNTTLTFATGDLAAGIQILSIENGGVLDLVPGVRLEIDATKAGFKREFFIAAGGLLQALGSVTTSSFVTRLSDPANPNGLYDFNIAGNIRARYFTFELMDRDGINMSATTSRALDIDVNGNGTPTLYGTTGDVVGINKDERCFSRCTITNGEDVAGATLLKVHNLAFPAYNPADVNVSPYLNNPLYIESANFPTFLLNGGSNVTWLGAATDNKLMFRLASGSFAGENKDLDVDATITPQSATNCIRWEDPASIKWTGAAATGGSIILGNAVNENARAAQTDWNNPNNWSPNNVPDLSTEYVVLDRTHFTTDVDYKVIARKGSAGVLTVNSIKIAEAGGNLPAATDNKRIILQIGDATEATELQLVTPSLLEGGGNFTVERSTASLAISLSGSVVAPLAFKDAIIYIGNANAKFNVGGSWSNLGYFINGSSTDFDGGGITVITSKLPTTPPLFSSNNSSVNFNIAAGRAISNGSGDVNDPTGITKANAFNTITFLGAPTDLNSNLYVQGDLTIQPSVTVTPTLLSAGGNGHTINIKGNWKNSGIFEPTTSTVIFSNTTKDQRIERDFNYPFTVSVTSGVYPKQPEEFYKLQINKPAIPTAFNVILDSRVLIISDGGVRNGTLILTNGNFNSFTNKEMIIGLSANPGSAGGNSYVNGPVGRTFLGASIDVKTYPIGDADGHVGPVALSMQTFREVPTTYSITQIPGAPNFAGDQRILPPTFIGPTGVIATRAHWNVKDINYPPAPPVTGISDMSEGSSERTLMTQGAISLPFGITTQPLPAPYNVYVSAYPTNVADIEGVSIIQSPAFDFATAGPAGPNTQALRTLSFRDQRGFGPVPTVLFGASPFINNQWIDLGGVTDLTAVNIGSTNFSSESFFHLANGDFAYVYKFLPLPVELISFDGKYIDDKVRLDWVVTAEKNVASYTVRRSNSGLPNSFVEIGTVAASIDPATINTYTLDDLTSFEGTNYYQLSQKDKGGDTKVISKIVTVNKRSTGTGQMSLYPNPSDNAMFNVVIAERNQTANIAVYSITGAKVFEQELKSNAGGKIENIDASKELSKGLYVVRVKVGDKVYQTKLAIN